MTVRPNPISGILHLVASGEEDTEIRTVLLEQPRTANRVPATEKHAEMQLVLSTQISSDRTMEFSMPHPCIAVSDLVLAVDTPDDVSLDTLIESVELTGAGPADGYRTQVEATARVSCALFDKRIERLYGVTYLPLLFAHSMTGQLIPQHPDVVVRVRLRPSTTSRPRLVIRGYTSESRGLPKFRDVVYQHQGPFSFPTAPGKTTAVLPLYHLVTHIAFWGVDVDRVRNVRLSINDMLLVDSSGDLLAYEQRSRLPVDSGAGIIFVVADNPPSPSHGRSAINMSRINEVRLEVETAEDDPGGSLHVLALNLNVAVWDPAFGFGMQYARSSLPGKPEPARRQYAPSQQ